MKYLLVLILFVLYGCAGSTDEDVKKVNECKRPIRIVSHGYYDLSPGKYDTFAIDADGKAVVFKSIVFFELTNGQLIK